MGRVKSERVRTDKNAPLNNADKNAAVNRGTRKLERGIQNENVKTEFRTKT